MVMIMLPATMIMMTTTMKMMVVETSTVQHLGGHNDDHATNDEDGVDNEGDGEGGDLFEKMEQAMTGV